MFQLGSFVCSEGADFCGPLQKEVELVEHQTREPDTEFKAAGKHWTDKVCQYGASLRLTLYAAPTSLSSLLYLCMLLFMSVGTVIAW